MDSKKLSSSEIRNGSKIMLMASQGLHQGDGPKLKDAPVLPNYLRIANAASADQRLSKPIPEVTVDKTREERWKITGVVALSECNLKAVPDEVWDCGPSARVLDLNKNYICVIPSKIGCLSSLQKLMLDANELSDDAISWEGMAYLKSLTYLSLNFNQLTSLPASLGSLTFLRELHVAGNKLASLPIEIARLNLLEILRVNDNRISIIPPCIGDCHSIVEVDLSSNRLAELPATLDKLHNLKALYLRNNGMKSLPSTIFKQCTKLSTLDLHGTEITMDVLRLAEGWEEFDERRRLKHQKQLDFRAGSSANFDEGADNN